MRPESLVRSFCTPAAYRVENDCFVLTTTSPGRELAIWACWRYDERLEEAARALQSASGSVPEHWSPWDLALSTAILRTSQHFLYFITERPKRWLVGWGTRLWICLPCRSGSYRTADTFSLRILRTCSFVRALFAACHQLGTLFRGSLLTYG